MSITGKIQSLFSDREKTQPIFPITKTKAVSNDDGVGLDVLLEGKAPAGYGLGTEIESHPSGALFPPENDCNLVNGTGWCYINQNTKNSPLPYGGALHSIRLAAGYIHQWATLHAYEYGQPTARRIKNNGVWGEWEWINPPMVQGFEYRTTERYNGKPVYTKLLDCGNGPNKYYKNVSIGASNVEIYTYCSVFCDYPCVFPVGGNDHTTDFQYGGIVGNQIKIISQVDATDDHYYAIVKYTKTTD